MSNQKPRRLVVIDGMSIFYRGYYAMPGLSTKEGTPTGGVYGFAALALAIIKKLDPDYVCVAWDKSKTNTRKRKELYPEYKAGRKTPPDDFFAQIPILKELLNGFSWPLYEIDDYEADDIMATLARKADKEGLETILLSSDMDLLQALSPNTKMFAIKKGFNQIDEFDPDSFAEKYGVRLDQFVDLKAIMGDSSDNIPGVAGIGKKGAADLLAEYDTLENIYENLDTIKESARKKLEASKDMAFLSKQIVTLMFDAPVDLDLKAMDVNDVNPAQVKRSLQELEFHSLVRQLPKEMQDVEAAPSAPVASSDLALPKVVQHDTFTGFEDVDASKPLLIRSYCEGRFGANPKAIIVSDSDKEIHVYKAVNTTLKDLPSISIASYGAKREIQMLRRLGAKDVDVEHDVQIAAFLLNPLIREQSLSAIARDELGYEVELDELSYEDFIAKAAEQAAVCFEAAKVQKKQLKDTGTLEKLAHDIEWPTIAVLADIELNGMKLDTDYLNTMHDELSGKISDLEQTIYGHADTEFNIGSPSQLAEVLFGGLGLPTQGIKKGKTGYSTAASELTKLKGLHPVIEYISEYREYTKLKSTYIDALPNHQDEDGRVRSDLRLTVTATGRLSSSDPNLQNIPVRTDLGKKIRNAFVADEGNIIISADYSQFELRLAAVFAGDHDMIEAFNSDEDIHTVTASQVFGVALEDVTRDMRYDAKTVNFGILYGQGSHGLAQQTGMSYADARSFIDKYFEQRSAIRDYIKTLREKAKEDGYVETLFGRRRPTPDVKSSNFIVREAAYRQAVNMPIQGSEADLMKMAMVKLDTLLDDDCKQIMQVHDSIMVECPAGKADDTAELMKKTMESIHPEIGIKLNVDVSIGRTWGEL